jgi:hypothetical protein
LIQEQLENFFKKTNFCMELELNEIRPGTWYGKDNYPIPLASDGTVVAIGTPGILKNHKFVQSAFELVNHFKINLYSVFGSKFDRKFPTIWSTLGYFDHRDFEITKKYANTFNDFKKPLKIEIDKLSLIKIS